MSLFTLNPNLYPPIPSQHSAFKPYVRPTIEQTLPAQPPAADSFQATQSAPATQSASHDPPKAVSDSPKPKPSYKDALLSRPSKPVSNPSKSKANQAASTPSHPKSNSASQSSASTALSSRSESNGNKWVRPRSLRNMMLGVDLSVKQRTTGNCYWVAAMDAAFRHPCGAALMEGIKEEVSRNAKGDVKEYKITFPSGRWGAFYKGEVGQVRYDMEPLEGPEPLVRLELAYAKMTRCYRNSRRRREERYPDDGRGFTPIIVEGGDSEDALYDMFGGKKITVKAAGVPETQQLSANRNGRKVLESKLREFEMDPANDYILCARTPDDTDTSHSICTTETNKRFSRYHWYAIHSFNAKEQTITVANPHDTSKEEVLTYDEACQVFHHLAGIKLPKGSMELPRG